MSTLTDNVLFVKSVRQHNSDSTHFECKSSFQTVQLSDITQLRSYWSEHP